MTLEDLQKKHERLVDRVRQMRARQREYLKYYASEDKRVMKRLEYEVDNLIAEEVKAKKSGQRELL